MYTVKMTSAAVALVMMVAAACGGPGDGVEGPESAEGNERVVEAYVRALNDRDWTALDTLVADEYTRHSQATPEATVRSREDFLAWARRDAKIFPDAMLDLEKLVSEGDHVAFWAEYTGRQAAELGPFPPRGEEIDLRHSGMHRLEDGRIAETWVTWDNLTALVQLGHWETRPSQEIPPGEFCAVRIPRGESVGDLAGG